MLTRLTMMGSQYIQRVNHHVVTTIMLYVRYIFKKETKK